MDHGMVRQSKWRNAYPETLPILLRLRSAIHAMDMYHGVHFHTIEYHVESIRYWVSKPRASEMATSPPTSHTVAQPAQTQRPSHETTFYLITAALPYYIHLYTQGYGRNSQTRAGGRCTTFSWDLASLIVQYLLLSLNECNATFHLNGRRMNVLEDPARCKDKEKTVGKGIPSSFGPSLHSIRFSRHDDDPHQ